LEKTNENIIQLVDVAQFQDRVRDAKILISEYAASLGVDLCFQNFDEEMAMFPSEYSPPGGALFLALHQNDSVGCVALRRISDEFCEMKRLYVRADYRGRGLGKLLAESVIERARRIGYKAIRLDTLPSMKEAISMYAKMGFKPIVAYRPNPVPGTMYLELRL
jgi:GNAT superfamily N-acetyltransferase